jgi:predicted PurR-regulated permease PerM
MILDWEFYHSIRGPRVRYQCRVVVQMVQKAVAGAALGVISAVLLAGCGTVLPLTLSVLTLVLHFVPAVGALTCAVAVLHSSHLDSQNEPN